MVLRNKSFFALGGQLARFGIVGVSAAILHFSVVVILVEAEKLGPLVANMFAFACAFQVSYWGNRIWTFSGTQQKHGVAFRRLLLVSTIAFMVNEALFYLLMQQFALSYPLALGVVLTLLPLFVFTANKYWVFVRENA